MNHVRLMGCITRSVEVKETGPIKRVEATLTGTHKKPGGVEIPWFVRLVVFGNVMEGFKLLTPGTVILVLGGLHYHEFRNESGGRRQESLKVNVREYYLMPSEQSKVQQGSKGYIFKDEINEVHLTGRLGKVPEFTYAGPTNTPLFEMRLAVNDQLRTHWLNATAWGEYADELSNAGLQTGKTVELRGRLRDHKSQGDSGSTYSTKVDLMELRLLSPHQFVSGQAQISVTHD